MAKISRSDWSEEEKTEIRATFKRSPWGREQLAALETMPPRKRALAMYRLRSMAAHLRKKRVS